jgi:ribokinase
VCHIVHDEGDLRLGGIILERTFIFHLGSVNIDHVYRVTHFVRPGETLASLRYARHAGGKGFNQSLALAAAGATVRHIGAVGPDGKWLLEQLTLAGVEVSSTLESESPTGHAVIQVADSGENAILLHPGANHACTLAQVTAALDEARPGDWFLAQNETSEVIPSLLAARAAGLRICFNPSPITPQLLRDLPLGAVDLLLINESEGEALSGKKDPAGIVTALRTQHPDLAVVLTLGEAGVIYDGAFGSGTVPAPRVNPVDTTAAGDTFLGFLLGGLTTGLTFADAVRLAVHAAAIAVTRPGAADSIPALAAVRQFLETGIPPVSLNL